MCSIHNQATHSRLASVSNMHFRTAVSNLGADPCPYGCGAHPYLTLGTEPIDNLMLRVPGRSVLQSDERGLPVATEIVEDTEYDFQQPRRIGSTRLDHAFTDLKRDQDCLARVELRDSDRGMQVSLWVDQSYPYLMIFSGDSLANFNRRSLAVEPMTCPPNAFRTGGALIRLESGSSLTSTWGIAPGRAHRR